MMIMIMIMVHDDYEDGIFHFDGGMIMIMIQIDDDD